jgi:uncharacterized Zn-finger protein
MSELKRGCENPGIEVCRAELPLCCPRHEERVWDAHPRVYLPIEDAKSQQLGCPYCGTQYKLVD